MKRSFYSNTIKGFLSSSTSEILGILSNNNEFGLELTQRDSWNQEIVILKKVLGTYEGHVFFEFAIPRMGKRIDVLLIIKNVIFVLEFKIGERIFFNSAIDQVYDYAVDLKNFHETSRNHIIAPILIASEAKKLLQVEVVKTFHNDEVLFPFKVNAETLQIAIQKIIAISIDQNIDERTWSSGKYSPTPTIIEAAISLYNKHTVADIVKRDASATNLRLTSNTITTIIENSKENKEKAICFVTGVPGAGKTLVGLDIATKNLDSKNEATSVFLSGNGPLVAILREALTRDKVKREKQLNRRIKKGEVMSRVKVFIQNVHHFRDEYLRDDGPPHDHVAIFDEAQRAWNLTQTANFMKRKKGVLNFASSEPEFLISCLDRHQDWAVIICLVGGGQEINTGEAGISEWIDSLNRSFPHWKVYISSNLKDSEYAAGKALERLGKHKISLNDNLHLGVSMRSFRANHLSQLVKSILDLDVNSAHAQFNMLKDRYPLVITRDLQLAKTWLKQKARGTERYGIVASSQAQRLKPHAIDVRSPMDPIHWFLDTKEDVRSSYYLEDVATEFHVQGLELDWVCLTWDADFRYTSNGWYTYSFVGCKWNNINQEERKQYLKNAYRVLLTRARQGMVIVVPKGDADDPTRDPSFYDSTFAYLQSIGIPIIN